MLTNPRKMTMRVSMTPILTSVRGCDCLTASRPPHDEHQRYDDCEYQGKNPEQLDECDHHRLLTYHSRQLRVRRMCCRREIHSVRHQSTTNLIQQHPGPCVERADVSAKNVVLR